jgi:hypothetical protein
MVWVRRASSSRAWRPPRVRALSITSVRSMGRRAVGEGMRVVVSVRSNVRWAYSAASTRAQSDLQVGRKERRASGGARDRTVSRMWG